MKITSKMPKKGQFVAVWKFRSLTCSVMLRITNDKCEHLDYESEKWVTSSPYSHGFTQEGSTDQLYIKL